MATSLTLRQTREVVVGGYKVTNSIIASVGIAEEVFAFTQTDTYDHICSVQEMETLPDVKDPNYTYYRASTGNVTFPLLADASEFATDSKQELTALVNDYDVAVNTFVGTEDTVIST